ncbi:hypothetical protein G5I_04698 [Acromyrmex echinatior]|uniref:Uncharacterized protein n=1 Tax=Acromyrmex echinatior TaxID=103372 RepID=F4WGC4_ACREC|nr:hypothetical protein G5I_04698 [Acromyrmex echinatior]
MRVNTLLPSSGSSRRKPRATRNDSTRVARSIAAAQWDQYPAGEYKPHNPPGICGPPAVVRFVTGVAFVLQNVLHFNEQRQIHVLSFSVFLPKARSQSGALRRQDERGDLIKRPDILDVYDDETLRAAFSLFRRNALTVSLLSAPLLIPDPVALSCRTRRVIYDRKMDRSGPTGRTSIHVLMPVRYGHNDGNVFILPTLRHDDRSTN